MIKRTPDDPCTLCQVNKADKKGSHITPAGIIKKVVGERDKEEIYSINSAEHDIDRFMGRSNLKNTDPQIKESDHVADYILCSSCEKKLGEIESECNQKLNILVEELAASILKIQRTQMANKYVTAPGLDKNVLALYLYSIIWRQGVSQRLTNDTQILPADTQEQLRQIVYNGISMSIIAIKVDPAYQGHPALEVLTTYHKNDDSTNLFNPNDKMTNPYLFFVGPYDVLLYINPPISPAFSEDTGLPTTVIDKELILNTAPTSRIGVLNEGAWMKPIENIMARQAAIYNHEICNQLAKATGMPYELARLAIEREAATFVDHRPADQKNLALKKLLAKYN